ncbi:putative U1 small nuclear ribonucleoprotein [Mucor lusitanicus]|uniref:Putative U1 small nuclear ribonucleo protein n=1 Tax=Mucor circinelloides f. lusitanicus TaxID=29924 RepID=A0A8H4B8E1_MUCCL|nr:putative U1 small nuclear ribonucleo protein [Mucor lusitanicus]
MWYLKEYDPIQAGSIDGTDTEPHDAAIERATQSQYRPPHHLTTDPHCTVFVGRLSFDTAESALTAHFEKYGEIASVSVIRNQVTGLSQGYGFVSFKLEKDARCAYKKANKSVLDDHVILVDFERSRVMKDWIPRRLGGGFGGKKDSGQLRFGARDRPFKPPASSHVRIPYDQKFSDTWRENHEKTLTSRSKSPSRSHHHSETSKRRRSRSPSVSRSRRSSRRSPSNDRHRHSHHSSSSSHRHSSYDRHKRHRHEERRDGSSGNR